MLLLCECRQSRERSPPTNSRAVLVPTETSSGELDPVCVIDHISYGSVPLLSFPLSRKDPEQRRRAACTCNVHAPRGMVAVMAKPTQILQPRLNLSRS